MVGGLQGQPGGLELGRYVAFPGMHAQDLFFTISTEHQEVDALPEIFQLKGKGETHPSTKMVCCSQYVTFLWILRWTIVGLSYIRAKKVFHSAKK